MKKNIWLFLEMVAVTIVSWVVLYPTIDKIYTYTRPDGYDSDRLVIIKWKRTADETGAKSKDDILHRLEALPEVECGFAGIESDIPNDNNHSGKICVGNDTIRPWDLTVYKYGQDCLRTLGIKTIEGTSSPESLSMYNWDNPGCILSRSAAMNLFGTTKVVGHKIKRETNTDEYESATIAAVVEDIHVRFSLDPRTMFDINWRDVNGYFTGVIVLRLHEGVSRQRFVDEMSSQLPRYSNAKIALKNVKSMDHFIMEGLLALYNMRQLRMHLLMAVFFLVNLVLGVIGSFWLKTRSRRGEVGIRRSFGASRLRIVWLFLRQGLWLVSKAIVAGTLLYLAYRTYESKGLDFITQNLTYSDFETPTSHPLPLPWTYIRWLYHLVVFAIIYLLMAITVTIGVTIPAWTLTRQKPIESLKEE